MPWNSTWTMIREAACSEGGGRFPDIQILRVNSFDDILACKPVVWIFFLGVGDYIGLPGVTMESISSGEIGNRHWTGEQGAAAAVVTAEQCTNDEDH